MLAPRHRVDLT